MLALPLAGAAFGDRAPSHALESARSGLYLAHGATGYIHRYALRDGALVELASRRVCAEPLAVRAATRSVFVVCPAAQEIVEIDAFTLAERRRLAVSGEPADLLVVDRKLYVTLPQLRALQLLDRISGKALRTLPLAMSEPRLLQRQGESILILGYRTGNGSTVLPGAVVDREQLAVSFNAAGHSQSPAQGRNPVPHPDGEFRPPIDPGLPRPPQTGHIVRQSADGVWRDDIGNDWTAFVSGSYAPSSGRPQGWQLPDHDLAILSPTLEPRYRSALLTHGLAMTVVADRVVIAGIEAHNQFRFEPNLRGRFVQHRLLVGAAKELSAEAALDLNPQLDAEGQGDAAAALAEIRAVVAIGDALFLAASGSHRIAVLDLTGARQSLIELPGAPIALAQHEDALVVFARDSGRLSLIDPVQRIVVGGVDVRPAADPALALGRRWLSDASLTSGNGTQSCAGCHLDGHTDRLAWDLGDPRGALQPFVGNCFTNAARRCADWHPMKGPMVTQSLRGIIGSEPFHWRGDRRGIHDFRRTYERLLGREHAPSDAELDQLAAYLSRLQATPSPYLGADGRLPTALDLNAIAGVGTPRSERWPPGNAVRGLEQFRSAKLAPPFVCVDCHALPKGLAPADRGKAGGQALPPGPHGEAHHGMSSLTGLGQTFKVPALTGLHDKLNPYVGIGFGHDGSLLTLADILRNRNLRIEDEQTEADILALLLSFEAASH